MKSVKFRHSVLLLLTAFIWGVAFVVQSEGGNALGPYSFNCIRTILGGLILIPAIFILDSIGFTSKKPETKKEHRQLFVAGISCGIALCIASNLQQLGLYFGTSAGKAGFLTSCYILVVPILGLFVKKKCGIHVWFGVVLAVIGLYLLCVKENLGFAFSDFLLMLCALVFSFHILIIDHFSPLVDGVRMSCIQFLTCGGLSAIPMFAIDMKHSIYEISEWATSFTDFRVWIMLGYAGFLSCGVGYTLQIIGQNGLNPTVASLLMSMESVFSVIAGWLLLNQTLTTKEMIGCVLIFIAIVLAQIPIKFRKK